MELRHIRYFVAVAEEQNITRAAARLHVSQPPLSRQIRELEGELGAQLLERTPRSVRLTAVGWAFLEECYRVLRATDEAVRVAQRAAVGGGGQLRLGYAPGPTQELLREVLRTVRLAAPEAKVTLHDLSTAEMLMGLREGRLDAALLVDPGAEARRGFVFERLRADPLVVAVAHEHRWGHRRVVRLREVTAEPLVIFSRQDYPEYLEGLTRALEMDAAQLQIAEECDSGASLFAAVEAGQGVALISSLLAAVVGSRLKLIGLSPAAPPSVVGLAYPAGSANRLVGQLIEAARRVAKIIGPNSAGVTNPT